MNLMLPVKFTVHILAARMTDENKCLSLPGYIIIVN